MKVDLNYSYKADNPDYSREIKDDFTFDLEKTPISAQWGKYSKTKAIKTTHEYHTGQTTVKHALNIMNVVENDFLE